MAVTRSKRQSKQAVAKPDTTWFTRDRFGMFIHWGLYALPARHEWVRNHEQITNEAYQKYFDRFDPDLYDPVAWARAAKSAGMKYMVITTKHHDGFCLWDSKYTDYKSTNTPWGKDLLKPMLKAFRDEGIRIGLYHSLIDWHHPEFPVDMVHPQRNDSAFRQQEAGRDVRKYTKYLHNQVRELLTGYGKIDILWFDFSYPGPDGKGRADWGSEALLAMVRKLQPGIIVNNRIDLPGEPDVHTPEQFVPDQGLTDAQGNPAIWEGCQTFSGSWGYNRDETSWKSTPMLIRMLIDHVSKGGNLLLNVGPTARGEFDPRALDRLQGIGEWMRRHQRSIYGCSGAPDGLRPPNDCRYTYNPLTGRLYLHCFAWPFKHVHLAGLGQRVAYAQLLNDASEIRFRESTQVIHAALNATTPDQALTLELPVLKPESEVPVIELYLK